MEGSQVRRTCGADTRAMGASVSVDSWVRVAKRDGNQGRRAGLTHYQTAIVAVGTCAYISGRLKVCDARRGDMCRKQRQ